MVFSAGKNQLMDLNQTCLECIRQAGSLETGQHEKLFFYLMIKVNITLYYITFDLILLFYVKKRTLFYIYMFYCFKKIKPCMQYFDSGADNS